MERFHHQSGILSSSLRWSLFDPEFRIRQQPAQMTAENVILIVKALHVLSPSKCILSSRLRWSLSDPEFRIRQRPAQMTAENVILIVKALHVLHTF